MRRTKLPDMKNRPAKLVYFLSHALKIRITRYAVVHNCEFSIERFEPEIHHAKLPSEPTPSAKISDQSPTVRRFGKVVVMIAPSRFVAQEKRGEGSLIPTHEARVPEKGRKSKPIPTLGPHFRPPDRRVFIRKLPGVATQQLKLPRRKKIGSDTIPKTIRDARRYA